MKVCVVLLKVVLAVVFVEAAAGASTGSAERVCPEDANNYVKISYGNTSEHIKVPYREIVVKLVRPCLQELQVPKYVENSTTDVLQTIFDGVCQKKSRFEECLTEIATNLEVCPDPTIVKVFNIMRQFINQMFESGCARNAERFVRLYSPGSFSTPNMTQLGQCRTTFDTIMNDLEEDEVDIPSTIFIFHKQIIAFKECFSRIELSVAMREQFDFFIDELINTMQCIHPQDGTLVTCATLDPALVNFTNICDSITQHNTHNLYDVLEGYAFSELVDFYADDINKQQDNNDDGQEDIIDNEKLREGFKDYCREKPRIKSNLQKVTELSRVCSKEAEDHEVNLIVDNIKSALEHACTDDGRRLSDVMFEVFRLKRTSPDHSHALRKCIEVAKLTRKDSDEHRSSSKNMRLYHELETFKECLINTIRGDQTSVDAATSLINEILGVVKCVNPEDGSNVLCASLMHDHSHSH